MFFSNIIILHQCGLYGAAGNPQEITVVYINVVKPILIVRLASAGTNEMRHREFNKSRLNPPRVN
jgi:hypothetical protein